MVEKPNEDTEPHVQQLFVGSYRETGMGPQGLAGVWFCVYLHASYYQLAFIFYGTNTRYIAFRSNHRCC